MELKEAIKSRRSCRNFAEGDVPRKDVYKLIEAARWAPSPANNQPWEFIVTRDEETKKRIYESAEDARRHAAEESGWDWLQNFSVEFVREAPILIAVLSDPKREGAGQFLGKNDHLKATACSVQNMLLRAHDLGYEGVWFSLYREDEVKDALKVPERFKVPAVVPVGKPVTELSPPKRRKVEDILHEEKYGD